MVRVRSDYDFLVRGLDLRFETFRIVNAIDTEVSTYFRKQKAEFVICLEKFT